jgi:Raf kinase inhibitor-like YbhB/YbcL family protein
MDMRRFQCVALSSVFLLVVLFGSHNAWAKDFYVSSPQLKESEPLNVDQILNGFGCTGNNISPELRWENPPAGTKSFAVTLYDPDAPTGSGWWHWVVFNIRADVRRLPANAGNVKLALAPKGSIQSRTDFGTPGYGGACPPKGHGAHHYIFTVFALDIESLELDHSATGAMVGFYLNRHALGKARITAVYSH